MLSVATAASGPSGTRNWTATAWYGGSSGWVSSTIAATAAATTSPAHQRQRGEGSDPVGVSSSTNPSRVDSTTQLSFTYTAAQAAPGSDPGRASSP